jgi:class 3 adenylate cyclase
VQPEIQYARTSDGVRIAYSLMGQAGSALPPVVYAANAWGDLQWYIHDEATRATIDRLLGGGWRALRFDGRGMGSSDRDVTDFSLDSRVRDLEAVVDDAGLDRFVLCGYGQGGLASVAYVIAHPERVSHLVLVNAFASGAEYYDRIPAMRALVTLNSMAEDEWEFFTITLASAATGFQDMQLATATAEMFRKSMTAAALLAVVAAAREMDVTPMLAHISVPTLVVEDTAGFRTGELAREMAASIPGARFVGTEDYVTALQSFVSGKPAAAPVAPSPAPAASDMAVILFADIAGSTSLTERIGDRAFRDHARTLDHSLREIIRSREGTPVEGTLLGDGVLAVFGSARNAIWAAGECSAAAEASGLQLHLGLHAGDVIREAGNVFGGAVNIAARIAAAAQPGELLVSQTVRDLARTSAGVEFTDRGRRRLKGVDGQHRLFAVTASERPSSD